MREMREVTCAKCSIGALVIHDRCGVDGYVHGSLPLHCLNPAVLFTYQVIDRFGGSVWREGRDLIRVDFGGAQECKLLESLEATGGNRWLGSVGWRNTD